MTSPRVWILAARPKTLLAAIAPVLIGTAMAASEGRAHILTASLCLIGALLLQIATNFCNDFADFKKGADTHERVGPMRATQAGLVSPETMLRATALTFAAAACVCVYFVFRGGWPYAVVGALALLSGWAYTAGPYPLGYHGWGDSFVLVFFGPVAVAGTYHLQTLHWSWDPVVAGVGAGLLSVAILVANNLRDAQTDARAGKRTLVVRFGVRGGRLEYTFCLSLAILLAASLAVARPDHRGAALAALIARPAWPVLKAVWRDEGAELLPVLALTARLLLAYAVLFSIGWLL
jgi:1,4-dihydroxy-2-naphthoate octaprenyltransferase